MRAITLNFVHRRIGAHGTDLIAPDEVKDDLQLIYQKGRAVKLVHSF